MSWEARGRAAIIDEDGAEGLRGAVKICDLDGDSKRPPGTAAYIEQAQAAFVLLILLGRLPRDDGVEEGDDGFSVGRAHNSP